MILKECYLLDEQLLIIVWGLTSSVLKEQWHCLMCTACLSLIIVVPNFCLFVIENTTWHLTLQLYQYNIIGTETMWLVNCGYC